MVDRWPSTKPTRLFSESVGGSQGSQRRPALSVSVLVTFQSSCTQKWYFDSASSIVRPESWTKSDGRPSTMSAGRYPVRDPLNVQVPTVNDASST